MNESRRADMHVHSTASELSKLGVQRSLALPECATPPEEVYELAKRQGMDLEASLEQLAAGYVRAFEAGAVPGRRHAA